MEKRMNKEELIELINSLKIDKNEYWILSSGALVLRGIYPDAGDLDIAVTEKGLEELKKNYDLKQKANGWYIVNDKIECIVDTKEPWKIEKVGEYNLQSIKKYYEFIKGSNREKDKARIPLIEKYMQGFKEYYKATKNNMPSGLVRRFFDFKYNENLNGNIAIDLGCGAGNDTEFLISKGFKATAVDNQEEVREIFKTKALDKENVNLIIGDFSEIELPQADLILANMSLFFVKENFDSFLKGLIEKVNKDGFFVANFLGKEDDWKNKRTTIEKEELLNYFKDFDMHYFSEEKYFKDTALGKKKFWHVYTVMAKKK